MKATIEVKNPTNYNYPGITRSVVTLSNPKLHKSTSQKIEGYETRLYYEYKETLKNGGFCQYVTLTYNDKHLPKFYGIPCLDNSHIRYLFHDTRFFKDLKKKHGYTFKYFVGSEYGNGGQDHNYKGKRGVGNNPHFHVILFFTPLKEWYKVSKRTGEITYKTPALAPYTSYCAIKKYWEGFHKLRRNYNFGICDFGKVHPLGLIQNFKAISYASKYCVKDVAYKKAESLLRDKILPSLLVSFSEPTDSNDLVSIERNITESSFSIVESEIDNIIKEFRSKHSHRVLCSHGLGLYGLKFIQNDMKPSLPVATDKGFITRTLPLYLYRKKYNTVKKDFQGKYYYCLNSLGKRFKCFNLDHNLDKLCKDTFTNVCNILSSPSAYSMFVHDREDGGIILSESDRQSLLTFVDGFKHVSKDNIFYTYAVYKKIYENRFYCYTPFGDIPPLDIYKDFRVSLADTHLFSLHDSNVCLCISQREYFPFSGHPDFLPYLRFFSLFDDFNSYFVLKTDRKNKEKYENWKMLKNKLYNIENENNRTN